MRLFFHPPKFFYGSSFMATKRRNSIFFFPTQREKASKAQMQVKPFSASFTQNLHEKSRPGSKSSNSNFRTTHTKNFFYPEKNRRKKRVEITARAVGHIFDTRLRSEALKSLWGKMRKYTSQKLIEKKNLTENFLFFDRSERSLGFLSNRWTERTCLLSSSSSYLHFDFNLGLVDGMEWWANGEASGRFSPPPCYIHSLTHSLARSRPILQSNLRFDRVYACIPVVI